MAQFRWIQLKDGCRQIQRFDGRQWRNVGPPNKKINPAQTPLGNIATQPRQKVVINAPFDVKQQYYMKIINIGGHRIGWWLKTTHSEIFEYRSTGVLDPKESVTIEIACNAFDSAILRDRKKEDHFSLEWTNTPEGAAKQFRLEWMQAEMTGRKVLPIEYNM